MKYIYFPQNFLDNVFLLLWPTLKSKNCVFFCFIQNPWVDLIDLEMVNYESTLRALLWTEEITVSYHHHYKQNSDTDSDWNVGTGINN